jgi:hypothetical protein
MQVAAGPIPGPAISPEVSQSCAILQSKAAGEAAICGLFGDWTD